MSENNSLSKIITDSQLLEFQQDGLDYLYNLEPTQNNLFWVGSFMNLKTDKTENTMENSKSLPNSQFRIQSINVDTDSLEFEFDEKLKQNIISGVTVTSTISINWIDDFRRSIQQYHLDWQGAWYDRKRDCLVNGKISEKFRKCNVVLFHYIDGSTDKDGILSIPIAEPLAVLTLKGLAPTSAGAFDLNMASSGAGEAVSYTYAINNIDVQFLNTEKLANFNDSEYVTNSGNEFNRLKSLTKIFSL